MACALWPLSMLARAWLAMRPPDKVATLPVPVVVVGNLIAGGAGKTPAVLALLRLLQRQGYQPGVVSRGFGRSASGEQAVLADTPAAQAGDEALLLRLRAGVPVWVGRDRVAAARGLLKAHPQVDILVSDDGLQHRPLPRDVAVVVFDERGIGNGWLLPAGPLREAWHPVPPPRSVVLYNAPRPSTAWPGHLAQRGLAGAVSLAGWWAGEAASTDALHALRGRPLLAAAGLAQPGRFFAMLREAGLSFTELPLPDHFAFTALPWPTDTPDVLLTEKDAVKLPPGSTGATRAWVLPLDFATPPAFDAALLAWLPPAAPVEGNP